MKTTIRIIKNTLSFFILIPNLPFILIPILYAIIQIFRNSSYIEMELALEKGEFFNDDFREWLKMVYPKSLSITIAILFYLTLIIR